MCRWGPNEQQLQGRKAEALVWDAAESRVALPEMARFNRRGISRFQLNYCPGIFCFFCDKTTVATLSAIFLLFKNNFENSYRSINTLWWKKSDNLRQKSLIKFIFLVFSCQTETDTVRYNFVQTKELFTLGIFVRRETCCAVLFRYVESL